MSRELLRFWGRGIARGLGVVFGPFLRAFDRGFDRFAGGYERALDWSLSHRSVVLLGAAGALGLAALVGWGLDRNLLPRVDQGAFEVGVELPEGTALARTDQVARALEEVLLGHEDVEAVFGTVGRDVRRLAQADDASGLHTATFQVRLRDGAATDPVVEALRAPLREAASGGTVTVVTGQATALGQLLGGSDADIAVRIRGRDLDRALDWAEEVVAQLADAERVTNVRMGVERGHMQYELEILRDELVTYGIQPQAVANRVDQGMRGILASEFIEFDRKIPIRVQLPDSLRYDIATLQELRIGSIPLGQLLNIELAMGPSEVRRHDQSRVVTVLADVRSGGLDRALGEVETAVAGLAVPEGFRVDIGGENEEMQRSFRDLGFAFALALVLVFMILAAQFESFLHPGTILAAVPLALIGAILALFATGQGLNTMSLIGIVILVGIVVNDSIVKVDFIVQARERGAELREAIMEAGRVRLRPIIMTTVTTVLGLTPMALGLGRGADLRAPLAISVIGGLLLATILTLIVVPVLFSVVEQVRLALGGRPVRSRAPRRSGDGAPARPMGPGFGAGTATARSRMERRP
ncbi:MAG: efflux RND transporter permease subunit [Gemmatimonadales bacterium]|nr:MAG: efflux RND transporter permease subunit [Gemmatimonadales bacterium]